MTITGSMILGLWVLIFILCVFVGEWAEKHKDIVSEWADNIMGWIGSAVGWLFYCAFVGAALLVIVYALQGIFGLSRDTTFIIAAIVWGVWMVNSARVPSSKIKD